MDFEFTPEDTSYAQHVADRLYKQRRFFLPEGTDDDSPLPHLPVSVFGDLYQLHQNHEDFYSRITLSTELAIREAELKMGIKPHKLTGEQKLVHWNRYHGGLEIFAIIPLSPLTEIIDVDNELSKELFKNWHQDTRSQQMNQRRDFDAYEDALLEEMNRFFHDKSDKKVLVVLGTRFECAHKDLLSERIGGLNDYPHLTSYFLYKLAHNGTRLSPHTYTVFDKLGSHISMDFLPGHARITPRTKSCRYDEKIAFATIL